MWEESIGDFGVLPKGYGLVLQDEGEQYAEFGIALGGRECDHGVYVYRDGEF